MTGYNAYPETRLRRLRGSDPLRNLVRETRLSPKEFIYPMFVIARPRGARTHRADAGLLPSVAGRDV